MLIVTLFKKKENKLICIHRPEGSFAGYFGGTLLFCKKDN